MQDKKGTKLKTGFYWTWCVNLRRKTVSTRTFSEKRQIIRFLYWFYTLNIRRFKFLIQNKTLLTTSPITSSTWFDLSTPLWIFGWYKFTKKPQNSLSVCGTVVINMLQFYMYVANSV